MRRMFSKNQIIDLVNENLTSEVLEEKLNGHFVKIIEVPESTTLSDEEYEYFKEGVFINGNYVIDGTTLHNPVFFPAGLYNSKLYGYCIYMSSYVTYFRSFEISESKVISLASPSTQYIYLDNILVLNGKSIPAYPSNSGTFVLKCIDGDLSWVAE